MDAVHARPYSQWQLRYAVANDNGRCDAGGLCPRDLTLVVWNAPQVVAIDAQRWVKDQPVDFALPRLHYGGSARISSTREPTPCNLLCMHCAASPASIINRNQGLQLSNFESNLTVERFKALAGADAIDNDYALQLTARLAYGITAAQGLWTPFMQWTHAADDGYRFGLDWTPTLSAAEFTLNLSANRDDDSRGVLLRGVVGF